MSFFVLLHENNTLGVHVNGCNIMLGVHVNGCNNILGVHVNGCDNISRERRMQPARGRFARFDLDRQMASTLPAH